MKSTRAPIVDDEDLKQIMKQEYGKYYISSGGNLSLINKKFLFSDKDAYYYASTILKDANEAHRQAANNEERQKLIDFILSIMILPLRIH